MTAITDDADEQSLVVEDDARLIDLRCPRVITITVVTIILCSIYSVGI